MANEERTDPAREGLEHLQTAAHEMIAAARSMLDAVEELIDDPKGGEVLGTIVGSVARVVGGLAGASFPNGAHGDDEPHVERIRVS